MAKDKTYYASVVLNDESANRLKGEFDNEVPSDWKWFGHHMTIIFNKGNPNRPPELENAIGQEVDLLVTHIGKTDRAIAVRVEDHGLSFNDIPHITLGVNVGIGAKPVESNYIPDENWKPVHNRLILTGVIEDKLL